MKNKSRSCIFLIQFYIFIYLVCVYVQGCAMVHVCKLEDSLWELVPSPMCVLGAGCRRSDLVANTCTHQLLHS